MKAIISADDLAKDVAGAEALVERHHEHKVTKYSLIFDDGINRKSLFLLTLLTKIFNAHPKGFMTSFWQAPLKFECLPHIVNVKKLNKKRYCLFTGPKFSI